MAPNLVLLPAVDVHQGQAVQLVGGVLSSARAFGDPLAAALRWQRAGAEWIHLVDLDAAFGRGHNRALLAEVVSQLDVPVQVSGGIVDDESLEAAMATGCRRVNVSAGALRDFAWCERVIADHGERIAISLDVRDDTLVARGSRWEGGDLYETVAALDDVGCARYVVTDVQTDGALSGPNLELLGRMCEATDRPVVASGGIAELAHLDELQNLVADGLEGAIVGTALHEGRFRLEEALALTRTSDER